MGLCQSLSSLYQLHSTFSINSFSSILKILLTQKPSNTYISHNLLETTTCSLSPRNLSSLETKIERVLVSFFNRNTSFKELQEIATLCPPFLPSFKDTLNQFIDSSFQIETLHICMESGYFLMDNGRPSYLTYASQSIVMGVYVQLSHTKIKSGSCYYKKPGPKYSVHMMLSIQDTIRKV